MAARPPRSHLLAVASLGTLGVAFAGDSDEFLGGARATPSPGFRAGHALPSSAALLTLRRLRGREAGGPPDVSLPQVTSDSRGASVDGLIHDLADLADLGDDRMLSGGNSQLDFATWWTQADDRCRMECPYDENAPVESCTHAVCGGCPGCERTGANTSTGNDSQLDFSTWWAQADERCRRECPYDDNAPLDPCTHTVCGGCPGCEHTGTDTSGTSFTSGTGTTRTTSVSSTSTTTLSSTITSLISTGTALSVTTHTVTRTSVSSISDPITSSRVSATATTESVTDFSSTLVSNTKTSTSIAGRTETATLTVTSSSRTAVSGTYTTTSESSTTTVVMIAISTAAQGASVFLGGRVTDGTPAMASALAIAAAIATFMLCCFCCVRRRRSQNKNEEQVSECIPEDAPEDVSGDLKKDLPTINPSCLPLGVDAKDANHRMPAPDLGADSMAKLDTVDGDALQGVADEAVAWPTSPENMPALFCTDEGDWGQRCSSATQQAQGDGFRFRMLSDLPWDNPRSHNHPQHIKASDDAAQGFHWDDDRTPRSSEAPSASLQRVPVLQNPTASGPDADFLDSSRRRSAPQSQPRVTFSEIPCRVEQCSDHVGARPHQGTISPVVLGKARTGGVPRGSVGVGLRPTCARFEGPAEVEGVEAGAPPPGL